MRTLLLLLLSGSLFAAIPGIPDPPAPGPLPVLTVSWFNDWFGFPYTHTDDHRTNGFAGSYLAEDWVVDVDDAMLTDFASGTRLDEVSVTLGHVVANDQSATIVFGGGLRWRGDLGGEETQNWWHRQVSPSTIPVALDYEDASPAPLLYFLTNLRGPEFNDHTLELLLSGEILSDAAALDVGLRDAVQCGEACQIWFGPVYQLRQDWQDNQIGDAVASFEQGWWLDYGVRFDALVLGFRHAIGRAESVGTISLQFGL